MGYLLYYGEEKFKMNKNNNLQELFEDAPKTPFVISDGIAPKGYTLVGNICIANEVLALDSRMLYIAQFVINSIIDSGVIPGLDYSSLFSITGFDDINRFKMESINKESTLHTVIVYTNGKIATTVI